MPKMITVKKAFTFNYPHPGNDPEKGRVPRVRVFTPGVYEIDDEMAEHPWIAKHYADGHIETPQEEEARVAAVKAASEKAAADNAVILAAANAAVARATNLSTDEILGNAEEIEAELNTPVSKLNRR